MQVRSSRWRHALVLVVALSTLSGCIDTTSPPSSMTIDPHLVKTLATRLSEKSKALRPYSGCLAYEAAQRLDATGVANLAVTGNLDDIEKSKPDFTVQIFDACLPPREMATYVTQIVADAGAVLGPTGPTSLFSSSEVACGAAKLVKTPTFKTTGAAVKALNGDQDATFKKVLQALADCIGLDSLVRFFQNASAGTISPTMAKCVIDQLVAQAGTPGKVMRQIVDEDPGLKAASVVAAQQCVAAGQR